MGPPRAGASSSFRGPPLTPILSPGELHTLVIELTPFPRYSRWYKRIGLKKLHRSPLGVPGTGLRVWDDCYGHKEDICGRSLNELNVIHTR